MKHSIWKSVLALGVAAGLAWPAQAQQGVTDTEIVIGSNGDLSGVFASFNVQAVKAAQMLFDEVNAAGGVHGRTIRFIVEDNQYQVPRAVQNFNKLINSDRAFAMLLNLGTPHNLAGFPLMDSRQVHNVSPLTAARQMLDEGDTSLKWVGTSSYYDQLRAGINYLVNERGATKVCSMYIPADFGQEVFEATRDEAEALGIEYADETTHRPEDQEFVGALQRLRASGCEIVSMGIAPRPTIIALGTAKRLGWNDVAFIGSSAGFNTVIAKVPEGVTEGYYAAAGWSDLEARIPENEALREWATKFQQTFNEQPTTAAQLGHAAATTLIAGLEAAGRDLNPDTFREGMYQVEFHDPVMDVDVKYGPGKHQGGDLIVISQIQDGVWREVGRLQAPSE